MDFFNEEHISAAKELLYKIADDLLIIGHRNSEWTGLGPLLEEDIAFSSMAQDKLGQSLHIYEVLHELGESDPDTVAFTRNSDQFHCCQLVELPIGEYDFSLMRHFLYDTADFIRFKFLSQSSYESVANRAKKFVGEIKYHTMHANTWVVQLAKGNEESHARMQSALNEIWNHALGIFEPGPYESTLIDAGIFVGEQKLKNDWLKLIAPIIENAGLTIPLESEWKPVYGGRKGEHTAYLQPLLDEMTEVMPLTQLLIGKVCMIDKKEVREILKEVMDPEIPTISIVDLGIVTGVEVKGTSVKVTLTPTFSGCPALKIMEELVQEKTGRKESVF